MTAALWTLSACDAGSEPGGFAAPAASSADAIQLQQTNVRATLTVSVEQTTTSNTPLYNAFTGSMSNQLAVQAPVKQFAIHAGYTQGGTFAYDQTALDSPMGAHESEPGTEVRQVRVRNGVLTMFNANGEAAMPEGGSGIGLHTLLETTNEDPLTALGGLVVDRLPTVGEETERGTSTLTVSHVSQVGTTTTLTTLVTSTEAGATPVTQQRVYTRRNGKHVLDEVRTHTNWSEPGMQISGVARLRFSNVTWTEPQLEAISMSAMSSTDVWGSEANLGGECVPGDPGSCPPPIVPIDPDGNPGGTGTACPEEPGGANLVLVHGILADGDAWGSRYNNRKVLGTLRCNLRLSSTLTPSLTSGGDRGTGAHELQEAQLESDVQRSGAPRNILIGHSQGGLISRRVAQNRPYDGNDPNRLIAGVITTGTPHRGANIARSVDVAAGIARVGDVLALNYCRRVAPVGCGIAVASLVELRENVFPPDAMRSVAMEQLRPESPAIGEVNAATETFPRYGIRNHLPISFVGWHVAGDALWNNGHTLRKTMARLAALSVAVSVVSFFVPLGPYGTAAIVTAVAIIGFEVFWRAVTTGTATTDGVVSGSSQRYPNASSDELEPSTDPSSHTGQIDTERSGREIRDVLQDKFGVFPSVQ